MFLLLPHEIYEVYKLSMGTILMLDLESKIQDIVGSMDALEDVIKK